MKLSEIRGKIRSYDFRNWAFQSFKHCPGMKEWFCTRGFLSGEFKIKASSGELAVFFSLKVIPETLSVSECGCRFDDWGEDGEEGRPIRLVLNRKSVIKSSLNILSIETKEPNTHIIRFKNQAEWINKVKLFELLDIRNRSSPNGNGKL